MLYGKHTLQGLVHKISCVQVSIEFYQWNYSKTSEFSVSLTKVSFLFYSHFELWCGELYSFCLMMHLWRIIEA